MPKYRVIFRRADGPRDRKIAETVTEQPTLADAIAWAYRNITNTRDPEIVARVVSVLVKLDRDTPAPEGAPND